MAILQEPRVTRTEPWDLVEAFVARQDRAAQAEMAAARELEMLPIKQSMRIAEMEAAKRLGIKYLEPELDIRDKVAERGEVRAEARGMRERTHSADQQIRANRDQLTTSSELTEGRAVRQGEREHGYHVQREQLSEARENRRSEREQREAADNAWTNEDIRRRGKEFNEPFEERAQNRLLEKNLKLQDDRQADALERQRQAIELRAQEQRALETHKWQEKTKYYEKFPELRRGILTNKVKMTEAGVLYTPDIVLHSQMKARPEDFEDLGPQLNPATGKTEYAVRDKRNREAGPIVPQAGQIPYPTVQPMHPALQGKSGDQFRSVNPADLKTTPTPTPAPKSDVLPQSTPKGDKNADRIQKSEVIFPTSPEQVPDRVRQVVERVGERYDLSPSLLASMMRQESGYKDSATSPVGAEGTMQFMPGTAARFNVDSRDTTSSVVGAAKYMNKVLGMYDDNLGLALASYNWGEGGKNSDRGVHAWLRAGADPARMPAETRNYVKAISGQPIEYWLNRFFNNREGVSRMPKNIQKAGVQNEAGDDLFYVDVG